MQNIKKILHDSTELILEGKSRVKNYRLAEQISELESEMNAPDFWNDSTRAQNISQKLASLKKTVAIWETLEAQHADLLELVALTKEDDAKSVEEIRKEAAAFEKTLKEAETTLFLGGEYDAGDAIL